jgi:hypothetical protein
MPRPTSEVPLTCEALLATHATILHERNVANRSSDGKVSGAMVALMPAAQGTVEPWLTRRDR